MKFLSKRQKAVLAQLARCAFDHVARQARARGETFDASAAALDTWRRAQVFAACGCNGLSQAMNAQYNIIAARFESLLGNDDRALNHLLRDQTEERRQLEMVLVQALASAGLDQLYAERIARDRWKCQVCETSIEQLRQQLFTVKNRASTKRRRQTAAPAPDICTAPAATT